MAEWAVNPLFWFLAVWGVATGLYVAGISMGLFPDAAPGPLWVILLNVVTFSLGYLTWNALCRLEPEDCAIPTSCGVPLTAKRLKASLWITMACGLVTVAMCGARVVVLSNSSGISLSRILSDPDLWRRMLTSYIDRGVYETRLMTIAISLSSGIFAVGFVLLGILLYIGKSRTRYLLVLAFFLVSLAIGFLNLGRKEVTVNILFVALSYLFVHRIYRIRRTSEVIRDLLLPPLVLAVLFVAIELLLRKSQAYERETRFAGFLFSLYWYIAAPLGAFAEFMKTNTQGYLFGQSMFFPIYKWLCRLHLMPESTVSVLSEKVYIPYGANVYSYLRNIYEDFGLVGVAVVPYVLGALMAGLRRRAEAFLPYMNLYLVLLVLIIFSFYNYLLMSNQYYLQLLFVFLFFRFRLTDLDKVSV
jgi:oligosaccharide repeat unit polymerase